jgi:hypothetical protein
MVVRVFNNIYILFSVLIIGLMVSCKHYFNAHNYHYGHNQKRHHINDSNNFLDDSLILKDYIVMYLSLNEKKSKLNLKSEIFDYYLIDDYYSDSIFRIFKKSLSQFSLPIINHHNNRNRVNSSILENSELKFRKLDKVHLFRIANDFPNQNVLIPIIRIKNDASKPGVNPSSRVILSVFIIRDQSILYYKSMKISNGEPINNRIFVNKERWDGLVHVAFWEYIELIGLGGQYNVKSWK